MDTTPLATGTVVKVLFARTPQTEFLVGERAVVVGYRERSGQYAVAFDGKAYGPFRREDFEVL
ncbi:hypothetical protein JJQ59_04805 [Cupriavidus necator]|uniref:Uncharacterized protein n=1 Tax=Cupriavidus necator TaxID=106590 RepID=A0A367P637_CUPNE|nr:hypothetical protein [Cupriavidus necator]QQX85265.1 hypothetical protein JJQ59_04805 [Cupriavidus necator]RCJ03309.1 hypothetical protein DDK22_38075 [Cupriavidus necator]